jgi:hypothetical protein
MIQAAIDISLNEETMTITIAINSNYMPICIVKFFMLIGNDTLIINGDIIKKVLTYWSIIRYVVTNS